MKLIIPCAGRGTRLSPLTDNCPKGLVKLHGNPIMDYILAPLKPYVSEYIFVVSYDSARHYKKYAKNNNLHPHQFFIQKSRRGLGDAVLQAKHAIDWYDPILIVNDDTILAMNVGNLISQPHSALAVSQVNNPKDYGVVETDGEFITQIIEKPEKPRTNLVVAGLYYIAMPYMLITALESIQTSHGRREIEYSLTDALQLMISMGHKFRAVSVDDWLDCGTLEGLEFAKESYNEIADD